MITNGMTKVEYLYGEGVEVEPVPDSVIRLRVNALKEHLSTLLDHSYYTRDNTRCSAIIKAIKFWETLDEEGNQ